MSPSAELLFSAANGLAMAAWLLLAALPRRDWVVDLVAGRTVPAAFAVVYVTIMAIAWSGAEGGFSSLDGVAALFDNQWLLLAGWIHYLAFDLLVGTWEVRDARDRGIPHLALLPCLALTFLFGPAGWISYLMLRQFTTRGAKDTTFTTVGRVL
jgi:hypothetical protein